MLKLGLRLLWRDWRGGELRLLALALLVAVATVSSITLFADRLQRALMLESASFLAADNVITSSQPIAKAFIEKADELELKQAKLLSFSSMLFSDAGAQLVIVKAVTPNYPLRGKLLISEQAFAGGAPAQQGPQPGEVWLESRLLPALDLSIGDNVYIGAAEFRLSKVVIKEPDQSGFYSLGPRALMHWQDVAATEVVQAGSRLEYRLLLSGDADKLSAMATWSKPKLAKQYRWLGVKQGNRQIGQALQRAESFLLLGGLLGVVLAGIAVAIAAQRYAKRHLDYVAVLKTLGCTAKQLQQMYLGHMLTLAFIAVVLGCSLGYLVQSLVVYLVQNFMPVNLPEPGLKPYAIGAGSGLICLVAFALPPMLSLKNTPPARVFRRDLDPFSWQSGLSYLCGLLGIFVLMWWYSGDLKLTLILIGAGLLITALLMLIALVMLRGSRLLGMQAGNAWRLALAGLQRRGASNALQILIFGLAIMLLLVLSIVRTSLLDEWQQQLPEGTPNHFVMNLAADEHQAFGDWLDQQQIQREQIYPMVRGRIAKVISAKQSPAPAEKTSNPGNYLTGERNFSWSETLPEGNSLVSGQWWQPGESTAYVSLEADFAQRIGVTVGDELALTIGSRSLQVQVLNLRQLDWQSMRPNFFMLFPPGIIDDYAATYMTGFHLEPERKALLNPMLSRFPTISLIEVDAIIEQLQSIIGRVTLAIELILGLILASGVLVLFASVLASLDERYQEQAILRTLGAKQSLLIMALFIEFAVLGLLAGVLATFGAEVMIYTLQEQVFEQTYVTHPLMWLFGPVLGMGLIAGIGVFATRKVVDTPPIQVLRELT